MRLRGSVVVGVSVLSIGLATAGSASADSPAQPPFCRPADVGGLGQSIPKNSAALPLVERNYNATATYKLTLKGPTNPPPIETLVTDSHGLKTFPLPPLEVGTYTTELESHCSLGTSEKTSSTLEVVEAVSLPSRVGTLTRYRNQGDTPRVDEIQTRLEPDPSLFPFAATTIIRTSLNGVDSSLSDRYGITERDTLIIFNTFLYGACNRDGKELTGMQPARVEIKALIAGAAEEPARAVYEEQVDCSAINPSPASDGCSMSGPAREAPNFAGGAAGLVVLGILAGRRHRRRESFVTRGAVRG